MENNAQAHFAKSSGIREIISQILKKI